MKFILLIYLLGLSFISEAQTLASIDTGKYKIVLPDYWKRGNKIWQILNDKLPLVCPELKDKDLCGDNCNPAYYIGMEVSNVRVYNSFLVQSTNKDSLEKWRNIPGRNF